MLMSTGLDRIFKLVNKWESQNTSDNIRHVSEFISFDGEMSFIDSQKRHCHGYVGKMHSICDKGRD